MFTCDSPSVIRRDEQYRWARMEHAWLLRAEGLKFREIAARLGVGVEYARGHFRSFSRRVKKATRMTVWTKYT